MKKIILNCKVQSYFGIELLKETLDDFVKEFPQTLSIIQIDYNEKQDSINGFQISIQYEILEALLKTVTEISRTFEMIQIDEHSDSYGFWIESVIEQ